MLLRACRLLVLLLVPALLQAQGLRMPQLRVPSGGEPVRIQTLKVDVQVVGGLATTTWDLTVTNPQDRVLEGELVFPLGEGQTVSRFALDVAGRLREGVVVEKAKARQVFEVTVRRNVDPGLLEKTAGNAFRARVYPVPAHGTRRIVLAYEEALAVGPGGLRYTLPFAFEGPIPDFSFRVQVHEQDLAPEVGESPIPGLSFRRWQRAFVLEQSGRDLRLDRPFSLTLPSAPDRHALFLEAAPEATYFAVRVDPRLKEAPKPLPRRLLLLVDASASGRTADRARELRVLEAYLARIGACTVDLVLFRDRPEAPRRFEVRAGDAKGLLKAIAAAPLDGASAYGGLDLARADVDEVLLLGDGLNTLGPVDPRLPEVPLTALTSAAVADHARLQALAGRHGGSWIDLTRHTDAEALKALTTQVPAFLKVVGGSEAVSDLYPATGRILRGPFLLTGRLVKPGATLTLGFGLGGRVTATRTVRLAREEGSQAPVRRLWAQQKLADLSLDAGRNAKAILDLGRTFGLVTEGTSLLVLEDVADYVRHRIPPPEDLREAYEAGLGRLEADEARQKRDHLTQVLAAFRERQAWWKTVFQPEPERKEEKAKGAMADAEGSARHEAARRARVGAPPPPSAVTEFSAEGLTGLPVNARAVGNAASLAPGVAGGGSRAKKAGRAAEPETRGDIELKAWTPDTPYLTALKAAAKGERYEVYLGLRDTYGQTPGFFLDVADLFEREGEKALARRILSNLAELRLEEPALLRVLGWRLAQLKELDLAAWVLEEVLRLREDEPQSRRDLALVLADKGEAQRALDLLWEVVTRPVDGRFQDIPLIALGELNALAATTKLDTSRIDPRFLRNLPVDVRVVLNWDTPESDMDLHIVDPRGETCIYSHNRTAIGGRLSADVTQGLGPEEFLLKKAIPGRYLIRAHFFGTRQQTVVGATTVRLELFLHHGTKGVQNKGSLVRLSGENRMVDVGAFVIE